MITGSIFSKLLKKIPYQLWLLVGVILTFWMYGSWQFKQGQKEVQDQWDESRKLGQAIVEDLKLKASKVVTVIEEVVVTETKVIRERGDVIIKEIPIYIPADTPDLPSGFRVLHDAASDPRTPTEAFLPGSPVSVEAATETIVDNYATCYQWKAQLDGLEDWYKELTLVWPPAQYR